MREIIVDKTKQTDESFNITNSSLGYMTSAGNLSDNEKISLPATNVKNSNIYIFTTNIDTFDSIEFVKERSFIIDNTSITITNNTASHTIRHDLTIGKNITFMITNEISTSTSLIRVSSDGKEFSYTSPISFPMDQGNACVISHGSKLNNCRLSWVSKSINAPIWIFGDSYLSYYYARWTYYLARDGYAKNVMLNGYAGQASDSAYESLVNLLAVRIPEKVVWCLGMNNPDSIQEVNSSWQLHYSKIIELQKKYGFELILYTVPTTPTRNHDFKNQTVRESKYRYIDADSAVRIDSEGHWVAGSLDGDNVHPTALGAKILYYRILADLPEVMCDF